MEGGWEPERKMMLLVSFGWNQASSKEPFTIFKIPLTDIMIKFN
jgi:hypothetical protein